MLNLVITFFWVTPFSIKFKNICNFLYKFIYIKKYVRVRFFIKVLNIKIIRLDIKLNAKIGFTIIIINTIL